MAADLPPATPPETQKPPALVAPAPFAAKTINVDSHGFHYVLAGNTLLPDEQVVKILEAGEEPRAAIGALIQAYRDAGYLLVTIVANVTGQQVSGRVVEGKVTETDMPSDIARFFSREMNRVDLKRTDLIRDGTFAESYAARQGFRLKPNFEAGSEFGASKMVVTEEPIEGAKPWNAVVAFNNLGNRYTSRYVTQASGVVRPGAGTELSLGYAHGLPDLSSESAGSRYESGTAAGSIVTPWGLYGAGYSESHYKLGGEAAVLNAVGKVRTVNLNGTQLFYASESTKIGMTETFSRILNHLTVDIFGGQIDLNEERYNVLTVGGAWNQAFSVLGQTASINALFNVSQGLSPRLGTFANPQPGSPTPRFRLYQANATYFQGLPAGYSLGVQASAQWADIDSQSRLPSQQQWVLGGYGNLTGWYPGVVSGDSGYLLRASGNAPSFSWRELSIAPTVFTEWATSRTSYIYPNIPNSHVLGDAGLGFTAAAGKYGNFNVAYAWPLYSHDTPTQDLSRARVYFNATLSF